MEKGRKEALRKVPTRKLLESIKKDLRKTLSPSVSAGKPLKKRP